ncbi:MAG: DUF29 domain-containing protein [Microcystaceae cyanobacterium]
MEIQATVKTTNHQLRELYRTDDLAWYQTTLKTIKSHQLENLDLDSLAEVLDNLVRDKKRSGASFLEQIIRHLLLIEYWETERDYNYRHWLSEIVNFRNQLEIDMTTNLYQYLEEQRDKIYQRAVRYVVAKTGLRKDTFHKKCPYTMEQFINSD